MIRKDRPTPDFIGIGCQRCATTWVAKCLSEHPEIYLPCKEIQFFNVHYEQGMDWYLSHFAAAPREQLVGEYTPDYLPSEAAINRLASDVPDAKLIVVLRDPIDRAISAYRLFHSRNRIKETSFADALRKHDHLLRYGLYAPQLERLFQLFDRSKVRIYLFEDAKQRPDETLDDLQGWLGVQRDFRPTSANRPTNLSLPPSIQAALERSTALRRIADSPAGTFAKWTLRKLPKRPSTQTSALNNELQNEMRNYYRDDVLSLSQLINRDLSHWRVLRD